MAFLHASPIRTTRPTCTKILLSPPLSQTPKSAEKIEAGTIRITEKGNIQLSYSTARVTKTSRMATGKTMTAELLWVTSW
ncbi:hypothetical protein D9M68_895530 [compost metagenome]